MVFVLEYALSLLNYTIDCNFVLFFCLFINLGLKIFDEFFLSFSFVDSRESREGSNGLFL